MTGRRNINKERFVAIIAITQEELQCMVNLLVEIGENSVIEINTTKLQVMRVFRINHC